MVVHLEVFTKWARHASPLPRYAPYWTGMVCVGVSGRRSRSPLRIVGVNLRNLQFGVPCVRSIRGRQSGSMVVHLEVFTKWARHASPLHRYAPYWTGMCVRGRFRAPFPFAPAHSQRQSAKSAVRCSLGPEHSRSTIGVDGRSPGGLYEVGEACLAPTQICPRRERWRAGGVPWAPFPFAPAHSQRK